MLEGIGVDAHTQTLLSSVAFAETVRYNFFFSQDYVAHMYNAHYRDGSSIRILVKAGDFAKQFEIETIHSVATSFGIMPEALRAGMNEVQVTRCYYGADNPDCEEYSN